MRYVLSIDQGTTGTRTILFDEKLNIVCGSYMEHKQIYPQAGWVEHDPVEILENIYLTAGNVLKEAEKNGISFSDIKAVGIANQGETIVVWDKNTGKPVYNAIVWQCRRTSEEIEVLKKQDGLENKIRMKTGLNLDSYYSASKIKWILDNVEGIRSEIDKGSILAGTLDTWILWNLTGKNRHVTDISTASRTMLFNINTLVWDDEILEIMNIPRKILPEVLPTSGFFGSTDKDAFWGLSIPVTGSVVDQFGALFGQGCFEKGMVKCTYGTGCFMQMNIGNEPVLDIDGILTSIGWQIGNRVSYVFDGGVYVAGAAIKWLRDQLKAISTFREADEMAESLQDTDDVFFVPAFSGLAAPVWDQFARGMIIGITAKTTREHIVRATLESIAYQVKNVLDAMENCSGQKILQLQVDGGITKSDFLMQFQSDILNVPVLTAKNSEATALGAALFAGLAIGIWKDTDEIKSVIISEKRYSPAMDESRRKSLISGWNEAVKRSMNWSNRSK